MQIKKPGRSGTTGPGDVVFASVGPNVAELKGQIDNSQGARLRGSNSLADLRERLKAEHAAVATALRTSVEHALAAGDILIEAKAQLNNHGEWLPWLNSCGISERTAQRYMRLARHRAIIEANPTPMSDLGIAGALALTIKLPTDSSILQTRSSKPPSTSSASLTRGKRSSCTRKTLLCSMTPTRQSTE
jgi:Protein of unknown function (DUF3102)